MSIQSNLKINNKIIEISFYEQGSASGTGSPGSRSPGPGNLGPGPGLGLILKSGTGTGTQIQNLRDLGPGLKFEKSGTQDSDRDASKNLGPEPGLTTFSSGTEILSNPGCVPNSNFEFQRVIFLITRTNNKIQLVKISISEDCGKMLEGSPLEVIG